MTNERIRWKQRCDVLSVEVDRLVAENTRLEGALEGAQATVGELELELAAEKRNAERAKIEGARGLANFLLSDAASA